MAGSARTGEIFDQELTDEVLQKAHKNTIELLKRQVAVFGVDKSEVDDDRSKS